MSPGHSLGTWGHRGLAFHGAWDHLTTKKGAVLSLSALVAENDLELLTLAHHPGAGISCVPVALD